MAEATQQEELPNDKEPDKEKPRGRPKKKQTNIQGKKKKRAGSVPRRKAQQPVTPTHSAPEGLNKKKRRPFKEKAASAGPKRRPPPRQPKKRRTNAKSPKPTPSKPKSIPMDPGLPQFLPQQPPVDEPEPEPLVLKETENPMSLFHTVRQDAKPTGLSADVIDKQRQLLPDKIEPLRMQLDRHARAIDQLKRQPPRFAPPPNIRMCAITNRPPVPSGGSDVRTAPLDQIRAPSTASKDTTLTIRFNTATSRPTLLDLAGADPPRSQQPQPEPWRRLPNKSDEKEIKAPADDKDSKIPPEDKGIQSQYIFPR